MKDNAGSTSMTTAGKSPVFGELSPEDREIVFAAFAAMVLDCHAPQDLMTEDQWTRAEELMEELDPGNIERFKEQKGNVR